MFLFHSDIIFIICQIKNYRKKFANESKCFFFLNKTWKLTGIMAMAISIFISI